MVNSDVIPLSIGLESVSGRFLILIPRGTTIPVQRTIGVITTQNSQSSVEIHLLQGERPRAVDNRTLGRFVLDGMQFPPQGLSQLLVTIDIDANGILSVKAHDKVTGKEQKITITASSGLSKEEVDRVLKDADEHAVEDAKYRAESEGQ